jgi:2-methylcitrate dehydratase PrpD
MSSTPPATVVGRLTELARRRPVTGPVMDKVRIVLGDALALALEARTSPAGRTALALAATAPPGPATVVGLDRGVAPESAVLVNSALIHSLLRDDAHADTLLHPAAVVLPVALALAEETEASTPDLVAAVIAGYEVLAAVAAPVASETAGRGLRNTAVFGPIGAAATAGSVLGLDDERFAAALLIASGSAGGTLQAFRAGSPEWRFQPGLAAQLGVSAARLAAALDPELLPFPGDALESANGLYVVLAGVDVDAGSRIAVEPHALLEVTHKLHATCGANQVPVAALSSILESGVVADEIVRIDVHLSRASFEYPGCEDYGPFREGGTFLSRPFALAATVLAGRGPLGDQQARAALRDPRLDRLARTVHTHVVADSELRTSQDAWITVELADGSTRRVGSEDLDDRDLQPDWPAIADRMRAVEPVAGERIADVLERFPAIEVAELAAAVRTARPRSENP